MGQMLAPTCTPTSDSSDDFPKAWQEERPPQRGSLLPLVHNTAAGSDSLVESPSQSAEAVDQEGCDAGLSIVPLSSAVRVRGD